MRGVLVEILQDCGFRVVAVVSGEEAVKFLSGMSHFDVVFSDIMMPVMNGYELAQEGSRRQNRPA